MVRRALRFESGRGLCKKSRKSEFFLRIYELMASGRSPPGRPSARAGDSVRPARAACACGRGLCRQRARPTPCSGVRHLIHAPLKLEQRVVEHALLGGLDPGTRGFERHPRRSEQKRGSVSVTEPRGEDAEASDGVADALDVLDASTQSQGIAKPRLRCGEVGCEQLREAEIDKGASLERDVADLTSKLQRALETRPCPLRVATTKGDGAELCRQVRGAAEISGRSGKCVAGAKVGFGALIVAGNRKQPAAVSQASGDSPGVPLLLLERTAFFRPGERRLVIPLRVREVGQKQQCPRSVNVRHGATALHNRPFKPVMAVGEASLSVPQRRERQSKPKGNSSLSVGRRSRGGVNREALAQNAALNEAEVRAWLNPEIFVKMSPYTPVGAECVCLSPRLREREHELGMEALAKGLLGGGPRELPNDGERAA